MSLLSNPVFSQDFGKLFTTPEERRYLDGLREKFLQRSELEGFNIGEETKPWLEEVEETPDQNFEFEMAGVMQRKSGGKAVWLNGASVNEQDLPRNVRLVELDGQHMLRIIANNKTHYVKTGQTLNIETGQIRESFERQVAEETSGNIADSIKDIFQGDDNIEGSNTDQKTDSVGISDLIEALQVIQETKNVN